MRSPKLTSAVMAAAAVMALVMAGAAAASKHSNVVKKHTAHAGVCSVSLNVAPRLLTAGETALAYGQATCPGGTEASQPVTLYQRAAGSPGFSVAGTTTTDAKGFYQLATAALASNTQFYSAVGSALSHRRNVKVAAQVTLVGPPETKTLFSGIHTGRRNAVTFTGTVSPSDAGATVVLQRQNSIRGNEWSWIASTIVNSSGGFAITHAFVVPGPSDVRVVVRSNHRNVASPSNVLSYNISQAQNPSLTILSTADPIAFGGATVVNGTAAGAPNTTLTLLGHAAHDRFAPVATTTTNAKGEYAFGPQSPAVSTFYKVQGAGRTSAVLYQGVKYVLTAAPLATTVLSGQAVSFSGTVSPAATGHTIYIERRNINNTGFHVAGTGTVGPGGAYTISRIFYAPGTDVLRVKIPGDFTHGGTASEPFSITIAPLPTAKLKPEPQGNGSLPPEGKV
jgi:hypothetical protein